MPYKALVTKPGKNALTATSPDDFYLNSDYPLLKVHSSGTFNFSTATGSTTINHNLGYKPFVLVFSQFSDYNFDSGAEFKTDEYYQHDWTLKGASWEWWGTTKIYDNSIVIEVGNTGSGSALVIYGIYFIFKDEV